MKALVLAGGAGTRLGQLTSASPKPMLPIGGRPFLEYLFDRLIAGGVEQFILSVHYRAEAFSTHFGERYRGVPIRYAVEPTPMGTGGAIAYALRGEPKQPILVLNGDSYLAIDYSALVQWYECDPVRFAMVVHRAQDPGRFGAVIVKDETAVGFKEKGAAGPALISAGNYILHPSVFGEFGLPERFSIETDLLQQHCSSLRARVYVCDGYFIDIGIPEDLMRAQRDLPAITSESTGPG